MTELIATVGPGRFTSNWREIPSSGWICSTSQFGCMVLAAASSNRLVGGRLELDGDLGRPPRHVLAGADVEGHAGPAPVVDLEPQGDVGLDRAVPARRSARCGRNGPSCRGPSRRRTGRARRIQAARTRCWRRRRPSWSGSRRPGTRWAAPSRSSSGAGRRGSAPCRAVRRSLRRTSRVPRRRPSRPP